MRWGDRGIGNHGTSANSSSHTWHLNELMEGAVTLEVGSLFQYFTTRIERDDVLRRRRLRPCRILQGCPLKPCHTDGIKKRPGPRSNSPENTLRAVMRSRRKRGQCRGHRPRRRSRSLYGSRRKPTTSLVANRWICAKQSASATRFGELT